MSSYHHGRLREATLDAVDKIIRQDGIAAVTLRDLGSQLGVSHAAFVHHFRSRTGLLTAFAVQGYELLEERLRAAADEPFLELGVIYASFAAEFPSHFAVMFAPSLLDTTDAALIEARRRAMSALVQGADAHTQAGQEGSSTEALAAWSLMHGLASLYSTGNLREGMLMQVENQEDLKHAARRVGCFLFRSPKDRAASTAREEP